MKKEILGTSNKVLEVDLSTKSYQEIIISEEDRKKYLGAKGLALKLLYDRMEPGVDPLGEKNMIVFMMGVYMGTGAPCSARFSAVTKSPLTGLFCHASCGGPFGMELKTAGWDGLLVKGKADARTILEITADGAVFKDAEDLWGKDVRETQKQLGKSGATCVIGPAGENGVSFANIVVGERFLGRGGMGAVMGAKNLKGIRAVGRQYKIVPAEKERFSKIRKKALKYLGQNPSIESYKLYGTNSNTNYNLIGEILPVNNFTDGRNDEGFKLSGEYIKKQHNTKQHSCKHCQILCGKKGEYDGETLPVPEFETTVLLGSNLGVFDPLQNARWNKICTDLGMDTISAGGTLGWVMEATEKGLIQSDLAFGKTKGVSEALNDIGHRKGFGKEMGMGSRALAEKYGGKEFSIQVKGMEIAAYDPRGSFGQGLSYATANRGGCHLSTSLMIPEVFFHILDPYTTSNKPIMVKYFEDFFAGINSMHTCVFTSYAYAMEPPLVKYSAVPVLRQLMTYTPKLALALMDVSVYSRLWSSITGLKLSMGDFLKAGERIHVLERYMNTREGLSARDDTLPDKLLKQPRSCDPTGKVVPLHKMIDKYYKERQFDREGMPTENLLRQLGIEKKTVLESPVTQ